jgi:hypothetical protein
VEKKRRRPVWLAVVGVLILTGCYWHKYDKLVRTHVEVLNAMAEKIADLVARDGTLQPEQMVEFRYPLTRARDFARIVGDRYGQRESYVCFSSYLDRYQELLAIADRVRSDTGPTAGKAGEVGRARERLRIEGEQVLDALSRS